MLSRAGGPTNHGGRGITSQHRSFPAPVRGLVLNENLARAKPQGAIVLDNWIPTSRGMRMRKGSRLFATVGTAPVESMLGYYGGSVKKLFAASNGKIFDITSVADPTIAPAADQSGLGANYWSSVNFTTSGTPYLVCVNGVDHLRLYDGSSWATITDMSSPAISGVDTSALSHVWVYRNRLYFVEKNTQDAWYLDIDSVGGTASRISLTGVFQKGGHLLFGATWSLDSGDGIDDKIVFVSDTGEIAVYEGSYPGGDDWSLVGRYDGDPPLGPRATMSAGGDLLIANNRGLVAVSASIQKDPGAIAVSAVSRNIEPLWTETAIERNAMPWEIVKWPDRQIAIVSTPVTTVGQTPACFIVNLETGAWATVSGWNTRCLVLHADVAYFGTNDGTIIEADAGGNDDGAPYYCKFAGAWDHCGSEGVWKEFTSARAVFRASRPFNPLVSVSTDYTTVFDTAPDAADGVSSSLWDEGLWDEAVWDGDSAELTVNIDWTSQQAAGSVVSAQVQVTSGADSYPDAELVAVHLIYREGAFLT